MKKLIISVLLASSLFGDSCLFWLEKFHDSYGMVILDYKDGDMGALQYDVMNAKSFSRYVLINCKDDKEIVDMVIKSRDRLKSFMEKIK